MVRLSSLYVYKSVVRIQSTYSSAPLNQYVVLSCGWSLDLDRCKVNGFYSQAFSIRVRKKISAVWARTLILLAVIHVVLHLRVQMLQWA